MAFFSFFSGIDNIINSYIPLSKFTVFRKRENRAMTPLQHFHSIKKENFRKNKTRVERMRVVGKIIWLVGALLLHTIGLRNLKRLLSTSIKTKQKSSAAALAPSWQLFC